MSVQTAYKDAPEIGFPGQLADINNSTTTHHAPAEGDIGVALGIAKGTDLTDELSGFGFGVKLPDDVGDDILGIAVRIASLEGEPDNTQNSVPTYREDGILTYVERGAIYVAAAKAVTAAQTQVYTVVTATNFPLGTLLPDNDGGLAIAVPGAFYHKQVALGGIVKIVIK